MRNRLRNRSGGNRPRFAPSPTPPSPYDLLFYVPFDEAGDPPATKETVGDSLADVAKGITGYSAGGKINGYALNTGVNMIYEWQGTKTDAACIDFSNNGWTFEFYMIEGVENTANHLLYVGDNTRALCQNAIELYCAYHGGLGKHCVYAYVKLNGDLNIFNLGAINNWRALDWNHFMCSFDGTDMYYGANGKILTVDSGVQSYMPDLSGLPAGRRVRIESCQKGDSYDNFAISKGCRYSGIVGADYTEPTVGY